MRAVFKILGLASAVLAMGAGLATASIYSSVPRTGHWTAQTTDRLPVSFKVKKKGRRLSINGFSAQVHLSCQTGDSPPVPAGDLTVSHPQPIPVDGNPNSGTRGDFGRVPVSVGIPGVTGGVTLEIVGEFESHRQYPPPGRIVHGEIFGTVNKDNGDYCGMSVSRGDSGAEIDSSIEWSGHPGH